MGPKERKEREKEQRREEIIAAGEKLFLQKGLNGTTMDEIARDCELSKGTLYLYFPSKENLHFEIIYRAMDKLYQQMSDAVARGTTPLEKLAMVGEGYYTFFRENTGYFRLLSRMMDTDHVFSDDVSEVALATLRKNAEVWDLITAIIKEGIADGTFKQDTDPFEIAISLYASSTMIMQIMDHGDRNCKVHCSGMDKLRQNAEGVSLEEPFSPDKIDFEKILRNLGWRIVMSIMTNPVETNRIKRT